MDFFFILHTNKHTCSAVKRRKLFQLKKKKLGICSVFPITFSSIRPSFDGKIYLWSSILTIYSSVLKVISPAPNIPLYALYWHAILCNEKFHIKFWHLFKYEIWLCNSQPWKMSQSSPHLYIFYKSSINFSNINICFE